MHATGPTRIHICINIIIIIIISRLSAESVEETKKNLNTLRAIHCVRGMHPVYYFASRRKSRFATKIPRKYNLVRNMGKEYTRRMGIAKARGLLAGTRLARGIIQLGRRLSVGPLQRRLEQ